MTLVDILVCIIGPILLRPMIPNDTDYMITCAVYGFIYGIGAQVIKQHNKGGKQ